ncbi:uncharacterized protein P884DRAFT_270336 [Thermothelomyces heterothallicus CBS 202.75]|uniref:uncharacterized protein n=1 Tax=Thermothelomyces heterothallicus CBS 202.75 TaxID=1149848 RepID=UPI0037433678
MSLYDAAIHDRIEEAQRLLDEGTDVNAQGGYFGTTLQAAAYWGSTGVVQLFLDNGADVNAQGGQYGTALQAAAAVGRIELVRLLLDEGADVNAQGGYFGTALQAAASKGRIEVVRLLLDKGADVNLQAGRFGTALQAATSFGGGGPDVVRLLLENGADVNAQGGQFGTALQAAAGTDSMRFIEASTWRSLLPGSERHLEIANGQSMAITKRSERYIWDRGYPILGDLTAFDAGTDHFMEVDNQSRRLFALDGGDPLSSSSSSGFRCRWWRTTRANGFDTDWKVQPNTVPSLAALDQFPAEDCFVECGFSTRGLMLPACEDPRWPRLSDTSEFNIRKLEETYGIVWIMTKRQDKRAAESTSGWESKTFFSTSEYAQIPVRATELLEPLVQQLRQGWVRTFRAAESRLTKMRTELLRASGGDPRLIRDLLGDAQLWDLLGRSCNRQIAELKAFQKAYGSKPWTAFHEDEHVLEDVKTFGENIQELEREYGDGLKTLADTSRDLIQLEFNLTSIAEAQKSRTTNLSMKRLSWITFVFLPLMFIASLFGMNVDVLASDPPWWIYVPFALGTMLLTLAVWLIFKYSDLEDRIEREFNRLMRRRRRRPDLESGQQRRMSPRRRTAMFPALGKKRS